MIEEEREHKKINIHVMPFKSLINIRSICPLAEIQRPVNANEWRSKAIRVHYRVPLVSTAVSLRLSTGKPCKCQTHNSKILCTLNDRWDTCAFCVSREKNEHKSITEMEMLSISRRVVLLLIITFSSIYWDEATINSDKVDMLRLAHSLYAIAKTITNREQSSVLSLRSEKGYGWREVPGKI